MRTWYLDNPDEPASKAILAELGIKVWDDYSDEDELKGILALENLTLKSSKYALSPEELGPSFEEYVAEMGKEHKISGDVVYRVVSGSIFIDVRDDADEWIRILLARSELILIPPTVYRREILTEQQYIELESYESPNKGAARTAREEDPRVTHLSHPYTRHLVVDLCKEFYDLGWVTGTGGSISVRYGNRIYMTPSGVQKERMTPEDLFVLDLEGRVLSHPGLVPGSARAYKLSACAPLFMHTYKLRGSGAVLHSHGMECVLATLLCEKLRVKEFRISHQEMIKGLVGHGYHDELVIPIIENTAHEEDLADSLEKAIRAHPQANAVLVARHGIYVWGPTWGKAKTQAECLHYLFGLAVKMHDLFGMDPRAPPPLWASYAPPAAAAAEGARKRKRPLLDNGASGCCGCLGTPGGVPGGGEEEGAAAAAVSPRTARKREAARDATLQDLYKVILLDIEGTTTPITFVHDVMFPYARDNVAGYLDAHWGQEECMADVAALRAQAEQDARDGVAGLVPIPSAEGGASDEEIRAAVVANVQWQISIDRKITALKQLQGHVWRFGFHSGALKGEVYSDVPPALDRWTEDGLRVAIYSSGSREAQQLLFGHTNAGDLRSYLSCYFDTKVGHKREAASYREIVMSLGCEAREVLFVTDIYEEAVAAREAGVAATLSVRPGNKPLPADCPFPTIGSFARIKPDEAHHPLNRL